MQSVKDPLKLSLDTKEVLCYKYARREEMNVFRKVVVNLWGVGPPPPPPLLLSESCIDCERDAAIHN